MLSPHLFLSTLFLGLPLLGRAQTTPEAPAPRYYVGLAAYTSFYQNSNRWRDDIGFPALTQLTAGYQLRPRLALELGVAYGGRTSTFAKTFMYTDINSGAPGTALASVTTRRRLTSASVLARYTLTRQPARRLQVDALGGFTLIRTNYQDRGFQAIALSGTLQTRTIDQDGTFNDLLLTAGLGLRYRLTPRLGLNVDLTANRNLTTPTYSSNLGGLTGSAALGLRYRFGK